jgi:error-prone DNA polymerase
MAFAELLGRSCFSFLEGASRPEELAERSAELGQQALALCDRDGLYGSVRLWEAAKELAGGAHRTIVGAELTLDQGRPHEETYRRRGFPSVALLVESAAGYAALCRLLTRAHAEHEKGEAGIAATEIAADCDGLFALLPLDPRVPTPAADVACLREAFGSRAAIATWRHLEPADRPRALEALAVSARYDLPIVASNRPAYHHRARKPLADVVACIRAGTTLAEAGSLLSPNAEAELKSPSAMRQLFPHHPEWIEHSAAIAERCTFSLSELRYHFPSDYGLSSLSPDENLRRAVEIGAAERYPGGVPANVRAQLDKELVLIADLEVAPYFLSVQQIVHIARERSILCQGRGSAANSAVCYVLGITAVDPVRSSLLFERFMSSARREPPDIDVDFEHERREEVIQELYRRYGRDRAAMVSEIISYRGKSALREVGKVFGLAEDQLDRLSSIASYYIRPDPHEGTLEPAKVTAAALTRRGLDPADAGLVQVVRLAGELEGFPRHLSIHVGGFVLSSEPLYNVAPVEPARMEDRTVIPWDKDDIETLGFFKVDVLGLGMLTAIRKALAFVHDAAHPGSAGTPRTPGEPFDPIAAIDAIPPEDPAVYDACCKGDTIGVFQIESRAQMAMLPILRPRSFYDLVVEVGIVRPGPIQGRMVHPYLRRRTGEEEVSYPHPCLEPILSRTLGVPLFQEQVMQLAITGAGYDPGEADQLRRDMAAWRKNGRLAMHQQKLCEGFARRGIPVEFAERLYRQILGFGEYGFPESHSASFALLVYASAWLKVHHPAAFAAALINSQPMGFYSPGSIVRDAQKHGVEVRPVRVESSVWDCTLEGPQHEEKAHEEKAHEEKAHEEKAHEERAVRLGFRLIRGLAEASVERFLAARADRPFANLDDFVERSGLRRDEVEKLAEAGACEGLLDCRREALWRARAPRQDGLFGGKTIEPEGRVGLPPITAEEQLTLDYGTVGLALHDHPMRHQRAQLRRRRVQLASDQSGWRQGQSVTVAGVVLTRQRPSTASGIVFITLEDETGTLNLVVYSSVFERYELVARHAGMLLARGRIDRRGEVVHVRVHHLERLDPPKGETLELRSRDFH